MALQGAPGLARQPNLLLTYGNFLPMLICEVIFGCPLLPEGIIIIGIMFGFNSERIVAHEFWNVGSP